MKKLDKTGRELEEFAELLRNVVDRQRRTLHGGFTAEEKARHDALLAREDVSQQVHSRPDLTDLMGEIAEWDQVCVATISARDNSQDKLLSALGEANIKTGWMSKHCGTLFVSVHKQDRARALSIIEADAKQHGYWVWLFHEANPDLRDTSQ